MKPAVREKFPAFTTQFEGRVNTMYLDVKGLVTVGVGCLIDTPDGAARLPFVHTNGTVAAPSEIIAAWHNVKSHQSLSKLHYRYAVPYNNGLSLPDAAVDDLMLERLDQNDRIFARTFPDWESFPAEAQLAIHSMGWAMGPGFPAKWPHLNARIHDQLWAEYANADGKRFLVGGCAFVCKIREEGNPGIVPRNKANRALFEAAAKVAAGPSPTEAITQDDRDRIEQMLALWFDEQRHGPEGQSQA